MLQLLSVVDILLFPFLLLLVSVIGNCKISANGWEISDVHNIDDFALDDTMIAEDFVGEIDFVGDWWFTIFDEEVVGGATIGDDGAVAKGTVGGEEDVGEEDDGELDG